jgi:hypothetical protein
MQSEPRVFTVCRKGDEESMSLTVTESGRRILLRTGKRSKEVIQTPTDPMIVVLSRGDKPRPYIETSSFYLS